MLRLRLTFSKTEAMRFTGHLDLHRTWERTIRRAGLPLAYSQGFHPHPRVQLAAALPLGFTSDGELADIWLERDDLPPDEARAALESACPPGIRIQSVIAVDLRAPALQTQVDAADYEILLPDSAPADLPARAADLLARAEIPRTRRGKRYDLRPLLHSLAVFSAPGRTPGLRLTLAAREGATGRPEEVLEALGLDPKSARVRRVRLSVTSEQQAVTGEQ